MQPVSGRAGLASSCCYNVSAVLSSPVGPGSEDLKKGCELRCGGDLQNSSRVLCVSCAVQASVAGKKALHFPVGIRCAGW